MQAQAVQSTEEIAVPREIDTDGAKLVYLALATTRAETIDDLQETLDVGKLTLCSVLSTLTEAGIVEYDGEGRYAAR